MVVKERFVIPSFIVAYLIPRSELVEILIGIYPTIYTIPSAYQDSIKNPIQKLNQTCYQSIWIGRID